MTPRENHCPECGCPTREWLVLCDQCAPLYAEDSPTPDAGGATK